MVERVPDIETLCSSLPMLKVSCPDLYGSRSVDTVIGKPIGNGQRVGHCCSVGLHRNQQRSKGWR